MYGHELQFDDVLKYQSPLRTPICANNHREEFMTDLMSDMDIRTINKKWSDKSALKLLFKKYI